MRNPQFGRKPFHAMVRLSAANTARDGSGTIATIATSRVKLAPASVSGNVLTVVKWSLISDLEWIKEYVGDIVTFVSGTAPTGAALNTEYRIGKLSVDNGTDTATFELIDPSTNTFVALSSPGSNLVIAFNVGIRLDRAVFVSAQATPAASSAMVGRIFVRDNFGGSWRIFREVDIPTKTASNVLSGQYQEIVFPSGYVLPGGFSMGTSQSVYAGAQDQTDVHLIGAIF